MSASAGAEVDIREPVSETVVYTGEPLVWAPQPDYETLTLTIRSGDTLDELFREHNLDIGHLAAITQLDEAGQRFHRIKPGDTVEITHDDGDLISLYSTLDLHSALKVEREDAGFREAIVDRPIEYRKRLAYGKIESSLFASGEAIIASVSNPPADSPKTVTLSGSSP